MFWFTRGKGIEDAGVVEHLTLEQPLVQETRSFHFHLPPAPFSCVGSLVSVIWALELIAYPEKSVARKEIEIGPGRKAVRLETLKPIGMPGLKVQFGR